MNNEQKIKKVGASSPYLMIFYEDLADPLLYHVAEKSGEKFTDVIMVYFHLLKHAHANKGEDNRTIKGINFLRVALQLKIEPERVKHIVDNMFDLILDKDGNFLEWKQKSLNAKSQEKWREKNT